MSKGENMTDQEIREVLRGMLDRWDACMEIAMQDASKEEAAEIVGELFTAHYYWRSQ